MRTFILAWLTLLTVCLVFLFYRLETTRYIWLATFNQNTENATAQSQSLENYLSFTEENDSTSVSETERIEEAVRRTNSEGLSLPPPGGAGPVVGTIPLPDDIKTPSTETTYPTPTK